MDENDDFQFAMKLQESEYQASDFMVAQQLQRELDNEQRKHPQRNRRPIMTGYEGLEQNDDNDDDEWEYGRLMPVRTVAPPNTQGTNFNEVQVNDNSSLPARKASRRSPKSVKNDDDNDELRLNSNGKRPILPIRFLSPPRELDNEKRRHRQQNRRPMIIGDEGLEQNDYEWKPEILMPVRTMAPPNTQGTNFNEVQVNDNSSLPARKASRRSPRSVENDDDNDDELRLNSNGKRPILPIRFLPSPPVNDNSSLPVIQSPISPRAAEKLRLLRQDRLKERKESIFSRQEVDDWRSTSEIERAMRTSAPQPARPIRNTPTIVRMSQSGEQMEVGDNSSLPRPQTLGRPRLCPRTIEDQQLFERLSARQERVKQEVDDWRSTSEIERAMQTSAPQPARPIRITPTIVRKIQRPTSEIEREMQTTLSQPARSIRNTPTIDTMIHNVLEEENGFSRLPARSFPSMFRAIPITSFGFFGQEDRIRRGRGRGSNMPAGNRDVFSQLIYGNIDHMSYEELLELDNNNVPVAGLDEDEINVLPTSEYNNSAAGPDTSAAASEDLSCRICLEEYEDGEKTRTLPCLHRFHSSCIDQWIKGKAQCPICRMDLKVELNKSNYSNN